MNEEKAIPFSLRMSASLKNLVGKTSKLNRRSINSEIIVLIENAKEKQEQREADRQVLKI